MSHHWRCLQRAGMIAHSVPSFNIGDPKEQHAEFCAAHIGKASSVSVAAVDGTEISLQTSIPLFPLFRPLLFLEPFLSSLSRRRLLLSCRSALTSGSQLLELT